MNRKLKYYYKNKDRLNEERTERRRAKRLGQRTTDIASRTVPKAVSRTVPKVASSENISLKDLGFFKRRSV